MSAMQWRHCFFLLFFPFALTALESASSFGEVKAEIEALQNNLKTAAAAEKSRLHFQLAKALYFDQEVDKSFHHFLIALETVEPLPTPKLEEEETLLYQEALNEYLLNGGNDPMQLAKEMLAKYGKKADENRHFLYLNFLMSTAFANLGAYDSFFDRFYAAYPYLSDSFIAYKTQGILYLRLSQHGRSTAEKHSYQEKALHFLSLALERNPKDASLYKVLILLAKDASKEECNDSLVLSYLQKMVESGSHIPRGDVYLYVREAVALGEYELAQEIIDKARALYEFSRALSAAQDYLNQHRG